MPELKRRAFFVMSFGKSDLEQVWSQVYSPVSSTLGFEAVRIDERDDGTVKIDQIINHLSTADLIIGDLTYERPNCYFELGYARAVRKDYLIIHCARRDHIDHSGYRPKRFQFKRPLTMSFSLSPPYAPPRVHFDLAAFDVLVWDPQDLKTFKGKFEKRVRERMELIEEHTAVPAALTALPKPTPVVPVDLDKIASELRRKLEEL